MDSSRTPDDSPSGVDVIVFDLFGVLTSFDDNIVYRRLAAKCPDPVRALDAMEGLVSHKDLIRGRLSLEQLYGQLVSAQGLGLGFRDFAAMWLEPYTEPMTGMASLVRELSLSYRLVLLSNVDKYYWEIVRQQHPELGLFSAQLLSWELGLAKPDREMFLRAIEAAGASASRCFFIDDKEENTAAARAVGLRAHRFTGVDDLLATLDAAGIRRARA